VETCNWLAKTLLAQGDLDGAAESIARAEELVPNGEGPNSERLRKAVRNMSARRALQRARDKANKAHEDASRLEKERRAK
jgi:hypothetical protein